MGTSFYFNHVFSFFIAFFIIGCNSDNNKSAKGELYFYAQYETHNRMYVAGGNNTLVSLGLEYEEITKDSIKGAKGKQLYLSFKKPEQFVKGATFEFPNPDIDATISNWATPNIFDLNRDISGTLTLVDYVPFKKVKISLNLKMRSGLDKYQTFSLNNIEIECTVHYRAYGKPPYELEEYDNSFNVEQLSPTGFDGKWKRINQIFYMPNTNTYHEYFYFPEDLTWDIQNGEFVVDKQRTPLQIEGRRFMFKELTSGNKMFFAINSYDGKKLTITNLNDVYKTRYVFERQ